MAGTLLLLSERPAAAGAPTAWQMLRPAARCQGLLSVLLTTLLVTAAGKKVKKKRAKVPPFQARCSACLAVASDLDERLQVVAGRKISETKLAEILEEDVLRDVAGLNDPHMCNAMKLRWHYLTVMDKPDEFTEAE
eukprot:COSAG05_NODE_12082_length_484_cov_0.659740_1_plen_135_part_01